MCLSVVYQETSVGGHVPMFSLADVTKMKHTLIYIQVCLLSGKVVYVLFIRQLLLRNNLCQCLILVASFQVVSFFPPRDGHLPPLQHCSASLNNLLQVYYMYKNTVSCYYHRPLLIYPCSVMAPPLLPLSFTPKQEIFFF